MKRLHKKHRRRSLAAFSLSCFLAVGMIPGQILPVKAENDTKTTAEEEIAAQAQENDDTFAPEEGFTLGTSASKPEAFDLRDVNGTSYVTPVRQQSPYGTCWGFGAIAAAESSILSSGLVSDPESLNLSEKQVAWFVTNEIRDSENSQNGEGLVDSVGNLSDSDRYNLGGYTLYATNMFASGVGPISENTTTDDGQVFRYQGKAGKKVSEWADWIESDGSTKEGLQELYYSEDDDWSISDKYRFFQDYRLKESYLLPSPIVATRDENYTLHVDYNEEATEAIKDQLLKNRAVAITVYASHSQPGDTGDDVFFGDFWAQYCEDATQNHVVTIVGYDDNFPKEKFKSDMQPPENGAWLVKNSWGSDTCAFPDNGYSHWGLLEGQDQPGTNYEATSDYHTGYYWLSYYDYSISNPESYTFEEKGSDDQIIHQYDYLPVMSYQEYSTDSDLKMANVFTADQNSKLDNVSFFTATPGTTVTYQIYMLEQGWQHPEQNGQCIYESTPKTYDYGGFHREELDADSNIILARNQSYAIVVEEKTPSGKSSISFGQMTSKSLDGLKAKAVINSKESLLMMDGEWFDLSNQNLQSLLLNGATDQIMDNFPIKAGLTPVDNQGVYINVRRTSGFTSEFLKVGETHNFKVSFVGATENLTDMPEIKWSSTDPDLISIEPLDSSNTEVSVKGKNPGYVTLIADAGIYGKRIINMEVLKLTLTYIYLGEDVQTVVYNGKAQEIEVKDVYGETATSATGRWGLIKDQDYTVSYENNIKCGKAYVTATGIGDFRHSETGWFVILPTKPKINKITPGENQLTVAFESQEDTGISGYVLSYKETGSDEVKTITVDPSATSAVITGLTADKTYDISMKAYVTVDEEYLLINKETWETYNAEDDVDYFGEESETVTSGKVAEASVTDGDAADATSVAGTEKMIQALKKDGDLKGSSFLPLRLRQAKATKNKIKLSWKKNANADGYILYGNRCGTKFKMKKLAELSSAKNSYICKKLKKGKYYKFLLVAYQVKDNTKKVIKISKTIHVATAGGKVGNHKAVRLNKKKITLKKGKTFKLLASPVAANKKKPVKKHTAIRFVSSNAKIATVNKKGKITAKKKGSCFVYAYAQNGIFKRTKVRVK